MQVTETLADGLKREFKVVVPAEELDSRLTRRLEEMKATTQIRGFRPGKVPVQHLRRLVGRQTMSQIVQDLLNELAAKTLAERGERAALQPTFDLTEDEQEAEKVLDAKADLAYAMRYEVLPQVTLGDFKSIRIERPVVEIDEAEVDREMERLARNSATYNVKEGPAASGDRVTIDYVGKLDGVAFEGGSDQNANLVLGSNQFVPGFEEQLVGAKAGDEIKVEVKFPEDYGHPGLAGKDAIFETAVKAVKAPKPAEIDDELAKKFGAESLDALKGQIRERLEAEYKGASRQVLKRALLDKLDALVKFDLPDSLVEAEAHQIAHQLWHEEHPEEHGHNHGEIEPTEEHKKLAERRVRLGLLLAEIGQKAEITVSDQEMTQAVLRQARQYPGQERAFFEFIQQNPQAQQQLRAPIFEDKVVDHIVEGAKVSEKSVTKEELEKAIEALDQL